MPFCHQKLCGELGPGEVSVADSDQLWGGVGQDPELRARHPGLGVRLEAHRYPVELGDRVEQRARVDVVRQEPCGGGDDPRAEVADATAAAAGGPGRTTPSGGRSSLRRAMRSLSRTERTVCSLRSWAAGMEAG